MAEPDYMLEPNSGRDLAATTLRVLIPTILQRWELAVRRRVPAAHGREPWALRDDVPQIVEEVAQALALGPRGYCGNSPVTRVHASERTTVSGTSLGLVLEGYALLREVILDLLFDAGAGSREVVRVVNASLDQPVQEALVRFSATKEAAQQALEQQHRLLVEGVKDDALVTLDPAGRVVIWNSGARRVFGYEGGEILGHHFCRFFPAPGDDEERCARMLREAREQEKYEIEGWWVRSDGTEFWAEGVVRPLRPEDGGPRTGYTLVARDTTERKHLEEQALHKADDLVCADQRKSEFLAMLAHELRTPLSAIASATYLLGNIGLDERAGKQLQAIDRQTRQLKRLVEDLLDVPRIRSGEVKLNRRKSDLCQIARDAAETVCPLIEGRGQTLHFALPAGPPPMVCADPLRMEQVVTNLLNNACKYTEPGGEIWLGVWCEGDEGLLCVRDSGRGIDPPQLPSIFDLFAQIEPDGHEGGGLGIGLALAKKLVELHRGTIAVRSEGLGRGTEFTVRLPLFDADRDGLPDAA